MNRSSSREESLCDVLQLEAGTGKEKIIMSKVRWGIIGSGGIARKRTIPGLLMAQNAECVAVMDVNETLLKEVQEQFGISRGYTSVEELLAQEDIDAVYIATPVFCHKEQVQKAAEAGKHILLEKPMGLTCAQGQEIIEICEKNGVKLGVGFMMRFHAAHQKVKELIAEGTIGEVVSAYAKFNCWSPVSNQKWRQTKAFSGGGSMMDMGIHCIDLLQYMTGMQATAVAAMSGNQIFAYPDVEDGASAVMRMENGALFTVEANFNIPDSIGGCRFEIYGTKGRITAEGTIGQVETGSLVVSTLDHPETAEVDYVSGNMYTKEIEGFSRAVLENGPVPVTAEEGVFDQMVVEAVYESQEKGTHIIF